MVYQPGTDFVAMWRNQTNGAARAEMPALDLVIRTLHRAGMINVFFNNAQPTTNQATTIWFRPAIPTYSGEGTVYLWDRNAFAYKFATPKLFRDYLRASQEEVNEV